jgi:hypothetical protein
MALVLIFYPGFICLRFLTEWQIKILRSKAMTASRGKMKFVLVMFFVVLAANFLMAQKVREAQTPAGDRMVPNGDGTATAVPATDAAPTGDAVVTGNGINYNGGPVLKGSPVPIYIIWYGNWNGTGSNTAATQTLIQGFLSSTSLGGSSYEAINTTYGDTTGNVSGHLNFVQAVSDPGSQGTRLRNSKISAAISAQLTSHALPTDPNGVYLFMTSSDVKESGFCTQFCGFHTHQTLNGGDIMWAFMGNTDPCPSGC